MTAAGLLVMVVAGLAASQFTPFWFDPDEGCALQGRCPGPSTDAALQALWALEWAGLAVVFLGLVLTGRRLRATPSEPPSHPLPGWAEAAAGVLVGMALCVTVGWFALVGALVSVPAIPAALCLYWLVQAAAVTALDRRTGPAHPTPLPGWVTGLVVSAFAVAALAWWAFLNPGSFGAFPVVGGLAVALGLLIRRAAAWRAGLAPAGARQWSSAGAAIVVLAAVAVVLFVTGGSDPGQEDRGVPVDVAAPRPPPQPPAAPQPAAPTASAPVDEPVVATVACGPQDMAWTATGWDAAMGTRAVTIVATSHAARPCYVDGFAEIAVWQGGRALRLTTEPGSPTSPEAPAARRVALAPGGTARFSLVWKGYGAASDEKTPQELTVTLPGAAEPSRVPLGTHPAPFDLVDGGTVEVGPWQPNHAP